MLKRTNKITAILLVAAAAALNAAAADSAWVPPMREVHKKFTGKAGSVRTAGDSNSYDAYYFTTAKDVVISDPLLFEAQRYIQRSSWEKHHGASHCNNNGWTVKNGLAVSEMFLRSQNPEVCFVMFGTNDMAGGDPNISGYSVNMRSFLDKLMENGTIPVLSTIPPRRGKQEKVTAYNKEIMTIAAEKNLALLDLHEEMLRRQPEKWDGILIYDGTHLSWNNAYTGFDEDSLNNNGNMLRNYITLKKYAEVYDKVLKK